MSSPLIRLQSLPPTTGTPSQPRSGSSAPTLLADSVSRAKTIGEVKDWLPLVGSILALYSIAVARKSLRLNRKTFEENRRRAAYNLLMTQPALKEIPLTASELESFLRERYGAMASAADKMTTSDFRAMCKDTTTMAKSKMAPLQRRLLIAADAWGDRSHTSEVRDALEQWIDEVCTQIDNWTKAGHNIEESISVHDAGQAKLLSCIVAKDCSDQAQEDPSWWLSSARWVKKRVVLSRH